MTLTIVNDTISFICEYVTMQGFEYPSVNASIEDISGMSGAVFVNSKFGRRPLSWEGILSEDVLASRRNLERVCRAGSLKTIKFETCDDLQLQAEVEVLSLTMPYQWGRQKYLIQAVAPDSRFYSQELVSVDIGETSLRGGASIPFPSIPLAIPLSTADISNDVVHNFGSEETEPIFTITGPGTGFNVTNVTTGESFVYAGTLDADDVIEINVRDGTVTLNGITNAYEDFTGDFIKLAPGDNQFEFSIDSDGDLTTNLNVTYRHAYSGI